jgi:hypothetical protein
MREKILTTLSVVLLIVVCGGPQSVLADPGVDIGHQVQFLFDDHVVESTRGLVARVNRFHKHPEAVLQPDKPWEERYAMPISAFYDSETKLYRMWYRPGYDKFGLAYAVSRDAITWEKPALGLSEFQGSRDNNRLAIGTGPAWNGVIRDDRDPAPARRYKLLAYNQAKKSNGLYLFVSPDGLNWSLHSTEPLLEGLSDCHTLLGWDPNIERYVAYVRPDKPVRTIARTTSEDMIRWAPFQTVLEPDDDDPPGTQFYGMSVFRDRGVYFGLLWIYHPNQLMIDAQLAVSRDGVRWQRPGRRHPILSYGLPHQFDSHMVLPLQPIVMGDEVKVLYLAEDGPHAVVYKNEAFPPLASAIPRDQQKWLETRKGYGGLATGRRDRFVSLDASTGGGELVTKPLKIDGRELHLNADARAGEIRVEILDEAGQALPGFEAADAMVLTGDSNSFAVKWKNNDNVGFLRGRTVRLRVHIKAASLYAFQVLP